MPNQNRIQLERTNQRDILTKEQLTDFAKGIRDKVNGHHIEIPSPLARIKSSKLNANAKLIMGYIYTLCIEGYQCIRNRNEKLGAKIGLTSRSMSRYISKLNGSWLVCTHNFKGGGDTRKIVGVALLKMWGMQPANVPTIFFTPSLTNIIFKASNQNNSKRTAKVLARLNLSFLSCYLDTFCGSTYKSCRGTSPKFVGYLARNCVTIRQSPIRHTSISHHLSGKPSSDDVDNDAAKKDSKVDDSYKHVRMPRGYEHATNMSSNTGDNQSKPSAGDGKRENSAREKGIGAVGKLMQAGIDEDISRKAVASAILHGAKHVRGYAYKVACQSQAKRAKKQHTVEEKHKASRTVEDNVQANWKQFYKFEQKYDPKHTNPWIQQEYKRYLHSLPGDDLSIKEQPRVFKKHLQFLLDSVRDYERNFGMSITK